MSLAAFLAAGRPLLADGATGTNLFRMGLRPGDPPELWNETHPDRIRALHQSFVDAGADIILTNTFGANTRRLALQRLDGRVRDFNIAGARLAREVADKAGRPVIVAGCVGPTGDRFVPHGPITAEDARAVFAEQMEALAEGGAEVAWIETLSTPEEMRAAAEAAIEVGLRYTLTASFDTAGRTLAGLSPGIMADLVAGFDVAPVAIGANCGVGPSDLLLSVIAMREAHPEIPIIAKASAGLPRQENGELVYPGTPDLMAGYVRLVMDAGADIIGGCCGTSPAHLAAMHQALRSHKPGETPTLERIVRELGPLAAPARVH